MNVLKDQILRAKVQKRTRAKSEYFLYCIVFCVIISFLFYSIFCIPLLASNGPSFIKAFIVIFLFCIVPYFFDYVFSKVANVMEYSYLTRLQLNEKLRREWRDEFLSTTFCNVYYLYIARKYNLLSGLEYYQKKQDFLNKKNIDSDERMIVLQQHSYLCFNANELQIIEKMYDRV